MNKKTVLLLAIAAIVLGGWYAWSEYNRGAAKASEMPVAATVTAEALMEAFSNDEASATARYVGASEQVVQVKGTIRSMDPVGADRTNVILETGNDLAGVVCEFANSDLGADWRSGSSVTINGFCTGMLLDVVMVRCTAVNS